MVLVFDYIIIKFSSAGAERLQCYVHLLRGLYGLSAQLLFFKRKGAGRMEVARDLLELKALIAQLGLSDDKRDSPRYKVDIPGSYYSAKDGQGGFSNACRLVDVSRKGASIEIEKAAFNLGDIIHLQFPIGSNNTTYALGKVVYIDRIDNGYKVGLQSPNEEANIISQLLSQ